MSFAAPLVPVSQALAGLACRLLAPRALGPLIVGLAVLLPGCQAVEQLLRQDGPTARVTGTSIEDLDLDALTLSFDVEVSNPYALPLPVAELDYSLVSASQPFLSGRGDFQGEIPAGGSRTIPLSARLAFADALTLLKGIRPGAVVPFDADLGISVDAPGVGPLRLPVRHSGEVPIPAVPEVSVESIGWESLTLSEATGLLELAVGNTNTFPLELSRIDYSLALGGDPVVSSTLRESVSLEAGETHVLRIPISLRPIDLGLAAFNMLRGSEASYSLTGSMQGDTRFGPLELPIAKQGRTSFEST